MILLSVIFRLQWYQIRSSLKSINHLFKNISFATYALNLSLANSNFQFSRTYVEYLSKIKYIRTLSYFSLY